MATSDNQRKPNGDKRRKLRNYLINPGFQWKFASLLMMTVFSVTAFMSVILASVLHGRIRTYVLGALQNSEPPPVSEYAVVLIVAALSFASVASLGVGLWTIIFTHRISGPLFILGRWLDELGSGRLPSLRPLRKKDEFKEFYGTFKRAIDTIRIQKEADLDRLTEAIGIARSAVGSDDAVRDRALQTVATRLESLCEEAADMLGESFELGLETSADAKESAAVSQFEEASV